MNIKIHKPYGILDSVMVTAEGQQESQELLDMIGKALISPEPAEKTVPAGMSLQQLGHLFRHIQDDEKLKAIKVVREVFGVGLKEAKDFIEQSYPDWKYPQYPQYPQIESEEG